MSHVVAIKAQLNDLETLTAAFEKLGGTVEQASSYKWWGSSVGDYPIPHGFKKADMGKCHYKVKFPGATYEVGIIDKERLAADHGARSSKVKCSKCKGAGSITEAGIPFPCGDCVGAGEVDFYPGRYIIQYDFYSTGGLSKYVGKENAEKLVHEYSAQRVMSECRKRGLKTERVEAGAGHTKIVAHA